MLFIGSKYDFAETSAEMISEIFSISDMKSRTNPFYSYAKISGKAKRIFNTRRKSTAIKSNTLNLSYIEGESRIIDMKQRALLDVSAALWHALQIEHCEKESRTSMNRRYNLKNICHSSDIVRLLMVEHDGPTF